MRPGRIVGMAAVAGAALGVLGCGGPKTQRLTPQAFTASGVAVAPAPTTQEAPGDEPATTLSPTVQREIVPPAAEAARRAGDAPGPRGPAGASSGQYLTLGAVMTEVNNVPIYVNRVLQELEPVFAARAPEIEPARFERFALGEIQKQTQVLVAAELEFAAAQRNLDERERRLAEGLTARWRQQQISRAGGSLERARQAARAEGRDFDELVREQFKLYMRQVYFQRRELPKIQIGANDMRRYYERNLDEKFTVPEQATFRLIWVSRRAAGSAEAAKQIAEDLRRRALGGEDFAALAGNQSDDASLRRTGGLVGPVPRGAFVIEPVDVAAWAQGIGEVGPVIETANGCFLVRVEKREGGEVRSFSDRAVQTEVRRELEAEQFRVLRDRVQNELRRSAIIDPDPPRYGPAMEMVMQNYARWRGGA